MKTLDAPRGKGEKPLPLAFDSNELIVLATVTQTCLTMISENLAPSDERERLLAGMQAVSERLSRLAAQRRPSDPALVTYSVSLVEALSLECAVRTYEEYLQKTGFMGMAPNIIALLDNVFYRVRLAIVAQYPAFGIQLVLMDKQQQRC